VGIEDPSLGSAPDGSTARGAVSIDLERRPVRRRGRRYNPSVLRQGPIPALVHGIVEYLAGVVFIVAPFVLGFQSSPATAISIIVGVVVLVVAASTEGPSGLISQIPISAHVALDFVLAAALIVMPFAFGFSEEGAPTAFFIALGVVHLLLTIATRFRPKAPEAAAAPTSAAPPSSPRG
jgi:hypothetical protein